MECRVWLGVMAVSLAVVSPWCGDALAATVDPAVHAELSKETDWRLSHTESGVQVYQKPITALGQTGWMGVATIPASVSRDRLFAVLADTESHVRINKSLSESVVLKRQGAVTTFYQVLKTPVYAPMADRWWVSRAEEVRDAEGTAGHLRRQWSSLPRSEGEEFRVRLRERYPNGVEVTQSHGRWDLIPLPGGSTRVIYRIVLDPGGNIPRGLASRFAGRSVANNILTMVSAAGG